MIAQRTVSNPLPAFLALLAVLVIIAGLILTIVAPTLGPIVLDESHGPVKHGSASIAVQKCLNQNGVLQEWVNLDTGRHARVCQLGENRFGVQIIEQAGDGWREVTSFVKDKMTKLSQVEKYLQNVGYVLIGG